MRKGYENQCASVVVTQPPVRRQPTLLDQVLTQAAFIHVPYIGFAAVAAAVLVLVALRRRRKVEEVVGEGYEEASA